MSGDVAIRPATHADLQSITDIYAHAVLHGTASYEYEPPSSAEMTARFDMLKAGGFPYVVADAEGAVTGYAYAGPFRTRAAYRFTIEDSIYLAAAAQGRGLGRRLLQRLIEESIALGFRQMVAVIGDAAVNTASVRLHAGAGFRNCGRIEGSGFKFGRWCDTQLMQLSLNAGSSPAPPERDR